MDSDSYQHILLVVTIVTSTLATFIILLRLISRLYISRNVFADDYLILLAWLLSMAFSTTVWLGLHAGWLASESPRSKAQLSSTTTKDELHALLGLFHPAFAMSKLSVLVYYLKLSRTDMVFRVSTIATMVLIVLATLAITISVVLVKGTTMNVMIECNRYFLAFSPINILTDMLIPLLPIPVIQLNLQLPRRQKLIVFATLGCGCLLTVVDVLRTVYLQEIRSAILAGDVGGPQYLQASSLTVLWSVVDVNFSVIIPCIPALKPLVMQVVPRILKSAPSTEAEASSPRHESTPRQIEITKDMEDTISGDTIVPFSAMFSLPTAEEIGTASFASMPAAAASGSSTKKKKGTDFGFYNVKTRRTLHNVDSIKQSIVLLWRTAILYLLIGFTTGFLEGVNDAAIKMGIISTNIRIGNNSVFYGAYLIGASAFAYPIIKRWSFKGSSITGMLILACGCLTFWPSVVLATYWEPVMLSYFVTGLGVSVIQTSASLYSYLAGPGQYAASRVLVLQVFQALGAAIAPIVVRAAMEDRQDSDPRKTEWVYLVIACFTSALMMYYQSLEPNEMRDDEIEERFKSAEPETYERLKSDSATVWATLVITMLGMFAYCGAQEDGHTTLADMLMDTQWHNNNLGFRGISQGIYTGSRIIAAIICVYLKPRRVLLACAIGTFIFSILTYSTTNSTTRVAFYLVERVFQAPIWPIGFACACQSRGGKTRLAAVLAVAADSGAAVFPVIGWKVAQSSFRRSLIVTIVAFAVVLAWAIYLNVVPLARLQVDGPKHLDRRRVDQEDLEEMETVHPVPSMNFITSVLSDEKDESSSTSRRRSTMSRKMSQALSFMTRAKTASISVDEVELPPYLGGSIGGSSSSGTSPVKGGHVAVDEVS